jgi:hypothetical protein
MDRNRAARLILGTMLREQSKVQARRPNEARRLRRLACFWSLSAGVPSLLSFLRPEMMLVMEDLPPGELLRGRGRGINSDLASTFELRPAGRHGRGSPFETRAPSASPVAVQNDTPSKPPIVSPPSDMTPYAGQPHIPFKIGKPFRVVLESDLVLNSSDEERRLKQFQPLSNPVPLAGGDIDLDVIKTQLIEEFPWAETTITRLLATARVQLSARSKWFSLSPALLTGPPSVGKSRLARRLSELAKVPLVLHSAAAADSAIGILGSDRGYNNSRPGLTLTAIATTQIANPIIFLDEIDKTAERNVNGRLIDGLLALLEPETSRRIWDICLLTHCDVSSINWILAANDPKLLPEPLKSRLLVLPISPPGLEHFDIVFQTMRSEIAKKLGTDKEDLLPLEPIVMEKLRSAFPHLPMRAMRRLVEDLTTQQLLTRVIH